MNQYGIQKKGKIQIGNHCLKNYESIKLEAIYAHDNLFCEAFHQMSYQSPAIRIFGRDLQSSMITSTYIMIKLVDYLPGVNSFLDCHYVTLSKQIIIKC